MKALVTGGTGFIGSHIVDHLIERGDSVTVLVRSNRSHASLGFNREKAPCSYGDLTDPASLEAATDDIDIVYHAAALLRRGSSASSIQEVNVQGTKNLLEACLRNGVRRIIFVSSVAVYTPSQAAVVREDAPLGGRNEYGRSKLEAENLIRSYAPFGLSYAIIRPCVTYGERDLGFTSRLFRLLHLPVIPILAGDLPHMNLVHVANVVDAAILAGTHPNAINQAYNITDGRLTSLQEIARVYELVSGQRKYHIPIPLSLLRGLLFIRGLTLSRYRQTKLIDHFRGGCFADSIFLRRCHYDISKAQHELGYEPKVDIKEGLYRTLTWRQQEKNEFV